LVLLLSHLGGLAWGLVGCTCNLVIKWGWELLVRLSGEYKKRKESERRLPLLEQILCLVFFSALCLPLFLAGLSRDFPSFSLEAEGKASRLRLFTWAERWWCFRKFAFSISSQPNLAFLSCTRNMRKELPCIFPPVIWLHNSATFLQAKANQAKPGSS